MTVDEGRKQGLESEEIQGSVREYLGTSTLPPLIWVHVNAETVTSGGTKLISAGKSADADAGA